MSDQPTIQGFDLAGAALKDLHAAGFNPEFTPDVDTQVQQIAAAARNAKLSADIPDRRALGWSSIDNDTSRDLDQIEVAERVPGGVRLHVAIADVAASVAKGSPVDLHAAAQTETIYTAVQNFPMLPSELSTGLTSLNEDADRLALIMSFTVDDAGQLSEEAVSRAWVRNRAQLAYSRVGSWLEASSDADPMTLRSDSAPKRSSTDGTPARNGVSPAAHTSQWLAEQLRLQDEAAGKLHAARIKAGALEFKRAEADPVVMDGHVVDLKQVVQNRAMNLIEDLMVAANGVMARALRNGGRSGLQRVVRVPQRWDRIQALAAERGTTLPAQPDAVALNNFLQQQHASDDAHYPDLALAVIKLLGAGEYALMRPDDDPLGHFGLAARDYTHSTAPNRRYPDLVTQRVLHAMLSGTPAPYSDAELTAIATHCNEADKALRKIDRAMQKRVAAVALGDSRGKVFHGVVTGASPKGVYARVFQPPFEGRITQNEAGLDVGACVRVKLIHTDPPPPRVHRSGERVWLNRNIIPSGSRSLPEWRTPPKRSVASWLANGFCLLCVAVALDQVVGARVVL